MTSSTAAHRPTTCKASTVPSYLCCNQPFTCKVSMYNQLSARACCCSLQEQQHYGSSALALVPAEPAVRQGGAETGLVQEVAALRGLLGRVAPQIEELAGMKQQMAQLMTVLQPGTFAAFTPPAVPAKDLNAGCLFLPTVQSEDTYQGTPGVCTSHMHNAAVKSPWMACKANKHCSGLSIFS